MSCPCRASRFLVLAAIVAGLVGCDQVTKAYAVKNLKGQPRQSYLSDFVRIQYVPNEGAFLGLLSNAHPRVRFWTLTVGNAIVLTIVAFAVLGRRFDRWAFTGFALIVAGGIGNLIDRVRFNYVIDFLNLGFGESRFTRTGIFNVADIAITAGFLMLLPMMFRSDEQQPAATATTATGG
jgi:signal peptidase II